MTESILNMTDDQLVSQKIIIMGNVVSSAFWVLSFLGDILGVAAIIVFLGFTRSALLASLSLVFMVGAAQVAIVRTLFMLHRAQLELRILATELPNQAATMVVKHMTPSGLGK